MAKDQTNYSRKSVHQIPDIPELQTLLNPIVTQIVSSYAPPITRTINGHSLENDIVLTAADVGARANNWLPTTEEINAMKSRSDAVEDNFVAFDEKGDSKDSGKNANSFLPHKYTADDATEVLRVDNNGIVQSVPQEDLIDFIKQYNNNKPYRANEVFYYEDPVEGISIWTTTTPHEAEGFNANHNIMLAKVGVSNRELHPTLSTPANDSKFVLSGSIQQIMQGLLNNIKNLQDRVKSIEDDYVHTDTPKVKLNVSSVESTPQQGYFIVRIDPTDILK